MEVWSTYAPVYLPRGKNHGTHGTGSWVAPKSGLIILEKRKNLLPPPEGMLSYPNFNNTN
jgi:hypothetical protein